VIIPVHWRLLDAACLNYVPLTRLERFVGPTQDAVTEFGLGERIVLAAWLANVTHETAGFRYMREIHDGAAYEGRADLGNVEPGDGVRFAGRGGLQLTGRANYTACAKFFQLDLQDLEDWLVAPEGAMRSAGWYFAIHRPECVDAAEQGDFERVCRLIGGRKPNGLVSRRGRYKAILEYIDGHRNAFYA
jgi:putative chitinase